MPTDEARTPAPGSCTVCLIVKNEKPYLLEWLAWYRLTGFDRIVVYDNNSSDGSSALLEAMSAKGLIDYRPWELGRLESPQVTAYEDAVPKVETEWVFFADIDEFLVLRGHDTVGGFLAGFAARHEVDAIGVNWRIFGDSFLTEHDDRPVVERFAWASETDFPANKHFKCFVRAGRIKRVINRHVCSVAGKTVHASGRPLRREGYGYSDVVDFGGAQLNHYYGKTFQEYKRKIVRGQAGVGEVDAVAKYSYSDVVFRHHNMNSLLDRSAQARLPALKAEIARWAALFPAGSFAFEPVADGLVADPRPEARDVPAYALFGGAPVADPDQDTPPPAEPEDPGEAPPEDAAALPEDAEPLFAAALDRALFDPLAYRINSGETGDDLRLFAHYLEEGWRQGLDPSERFSTGHYLQDYPGVADAQINPLRHYLKGRAAGQRIFHRNVAGQVVVDADDLEPGLLGVYFDAAYYGRQAGDEVFADEDTALRHYLEQGWLLKLDPSPRFSTRAYLDSYADVASAGINPLAHFILSGAGEGRTAQSVPEPEVPAPEQQDAVRAAFDAAHYRRQVGDDYAGDDELFERFMAGEWREGFDPSPDFSVAYYLRANRDIASADINPFVHYILAGREEGRPSILPGSAREGLERQIAIFADWASSQPMGRQPRGEDRVSRLLAAPFADFALLGRQLGAGPDPRAIAEAFLALPPAERPQPGGLYDPEFVAEHYGHLAADGDVLSGLLDAGLKDPPYTSRALLERDLAVMAGLGRFDARHYDLQLRREGLERGGLSPAEHYLLAGADQDLSPDGMFDTAFYRRLSRLTTSADANPYVHYLLSMRFDHTFASYEALQARVAELRAVEDFDEDLYRAQEGLPADADARVHFALTGNRSRARVSAVYDSSRYLSTYPDIGRSGNNGLLHFTRSGRGEGRVAAGNAAEERVETGGQLVFDEQGGTRSVLVLSHEASRTGAPIVALNLAKALAERYKVVTWTGKTGPLTPDFRACATDHIGGFANGCTGDDILSQLSVEHSFAFAIVNSIVSQPMLSLLSRHDIPAISLIHEFASYVYPEGTVSRAAVRSGATVFPATVVEQDFRDELRTIGMVQGVPNVARIPQGANQPPTAGFDEDELRALKRRFGIRADGTSRVVFGAGSVNIRKGVDLFIQTAAALAGDTTHDWRFVWVGGGYDPLRDMGYSVYLREQVRKSGLEGRFFFVGEQPNLDLYWAISDVFLLSSRLDPFPNVVIDAIVKHVPVVCFEGATGAADVVPDLPFAVFTAPYMDAAGAARVCREVVAREQQIRADFAAADIEGYFSFDRYVERLSALAPAAAARTRARAGIRSAVRAQADPVTPDTFNLVNTAAFIATGDAAAQLDFAIDLFLCDDYRPYFAEIEGRPLLSSLAFSVPQSEARPVAADDAEGLDYTAVLWGTPHALAQQRLRILPKLQRLSDLAPVVCSGSEGEGGFATAFAGEDLVVAMQAMLAERQPEWVLNLAGNLSLPQNGDSAAGRRRLFLPVESSLNLAAGLAAGPSKPVAILMPATLTPLDPAERRRLAAAGHAQSDLSLCGLSGLLHADTLRECLHGFGPEWAPFITRPWAAQMREIELRFYEFCAGRKLAIVRHPHF